MHAEVPSAKTLGQIRNAFGFIRRDTIKLWVAFGFAAVLAGLALYSYQKGGSRTTERLGYSP